MFPLFKRSKGEEGWGWGEEQSARTHNLSHDNLSFSFLSFFLNQTSAVVYLKNQTPASCPHHNRRKPVLCWFLFWICFLFKSGIRLWYSAQLEIGWELSGCTQQGLNVTCIMCTYPRGFEALPLACWWQVWQTKKTKEREREKKCVLFVAQGGH